MANLNTIMGHASAQAGYSADNNSPIFGENLPDFQVASGLLTAYKWDDEAKRYSSEVDHTYIYVVVTGGEPFRLKLPANATMTGLSVGDFVTFDGLESCFVNGDGRRQVFFRASGLTKAAKK